jgi:hypothetical protein
MSTLSEFKKSIEKNNTVVHYQKVTEFYNNFYNLNLFDKKPLNNSELKKRVTFFTNKLNKYKNYCSLFNEFELINLLFNATQNEYLGTKFNVDKENIKKFTPLFELLIEKLSDKSCLDRVDEKNKESNQFCFELFQVLNMISFHEDMTDSNNVFTQKFDNILAHFFKKWNYSDIVNQMKFLEDEKTNNANFNLSFSMLIKITDHYGFIRTENNSSPYTIAIYNNQLDFFKYLENKLPYNTYDNSLNEGIYGTNTSITTNLTLALLDIQFTDALQYKINEEDKINAWQAYQPMLNYLYEKDKDALNFEENGLPKIFELFLIDGQILSLGFLFNKTFDFSKPSYEYYTEIINNTFEKNKHLITKTSHPKINELKNYINSLEKERLEKMIEEKPVNTKKIKI